MVRRHSFARLPEQWLLSDPRNDHVLEKALRCIRSGSGFIFRHYHLGVAARRDLFMRLRRIAKARGHVVILAGSPALARKWKADGYYGSPAALRPRGGGMLALAAVHDMSELAMANRMQADAALLSPVFPTRSHPGAKTLGPLRFRLMATHATMPIIALGGMDQNRANRLRWARWAAIDGLSTGYPRPDS